PHCTISSTPSYHHPALHPLPTRRSSDLQIAIADGEGLRLRQEDVALNGAAIECRINAEDPGRDFMPSPGALSVVDRPKGEGIRRSEEHTSELQSRENLVCRLLLEKKKKL